MIECVLESVLSRPSTADTIRLWDLSCWWSPSCRLARRSWPSAFVPLGTSLLAVCLSQAVLKQQRGIHANKRLDTPLDELQSRLREALLVDRAVRLRTSAISFSLS